MSFTSLWYFPFLCAVAGACRFVHTKARVFLLLMASWFVYGLFGMRNFLLLIFVTGVSYLFGLLMERCRAGRRIFALAAGGIMVAGGLFKTVRPVGVSFYTFQALSYLIDVYRGRASERSFVKYALYISFFPQLVAGPIEQADSLIPQLGARKATGKDVSVGVKYLLSGCVRKFVIADYMALFTDRVYGNVTGQSGVDLLLATLFFAIQIYCDFSGYTHIAIGSARFLGVELTENFDRPYLATGCRDFWKRWHITLTKWFTEYVYIPLGGNRKGTGRKYFNIMVVFLLSGLWHGTNLTFLCWGALFGIWRIAEEILRKKSGSGKKKETLPGLWMKRAVTFLLVLLSWVLFRSRSMVEALEVLQRIFTLEGTRLPGIKGTELLGAVVRVGILALLPEILKDGENGESVKMYYTAAVLSFLIAVGLLFLWGNGGGSSFIYFQF